MTTGHSYRDTFTSRYQNSVQHKDCTYFIIYIILNIICVLLYFTYCSLDTATTEEKNFVIEEIIAIDIDQGYNGEIIFTLEQDSTDFAIDPNSGKCCIKYSTLYYSMCYIHGPINIISLYQLKGILSNPATMK